MVSYPLGRCFLVTFDPKHWHTKYTSAVFVPKWMKNVTASIKAARKLTLRMFKADFDETAV